MTSSSSEIRSAFLNYFSGHGHQIVPSAPLVPSSDPTLMFVNAGMVPFKNIFTGKEPKPYPRATSSQKCIRISGKHNDLENVGVTARHHTFFEMLGNFSFGDYFKAGAIEYAWDFFTRVLQIPRERLVVTVFGGQDNLPADDEAAALWRKITGLSDERILRMGAEDNFWQMGDTGPCGPCSEIHYFFGDGTPDLGRFGQEPGADGRGWVELWNLVFMQFDRQASGELVPLPAPSIDTGAGLERLCAVTQGVVSNYDTDLLRPIVERAAEIAKKTYRGSMAQDDISLRVIADHARTAAFLIAEGVFPDRDGRAYVLRRVMRRAIRHGHLLGIERTFFHECALQAATQMGEHYRELQERRALIDEICQQEEERFRVTLRRGLELVRENTEWTPSAGGGKLLPGAVAFTLYDTYGFPLDLQEVIGREQGFGVDLEGFENEMQKARQRSAGSKVGDAEVSAVYRDVLGRVGPTTFVGYDRETADSEILAVLQAGVQVPLLAAGQEGEVVVGLSPFYAESGGQVGDRGSIQTADGTFEVLDTQRYLDGLVVHRGRVTAGTLGKGAAAQLTVDHEQRAATRRNHSATHLLHYALRTVVGPHATQKGSLVGPDRLRFDYSATKALTDAQLEQIENLVYEKILLNAPIETEVLAYDEAKAKGAIGIFEEKYGAVVRMLRMTDDSIELCGGTHATRTGDLGLFKILSDTSLAAGVRRIEAATGAQALGYVRTLERELQRTAAVVKLGKAAPLQLAERVERLVAEEHRLRKELEKTRKQMASGTSVDVLQQARRQGDIQVLGAVVPATDVDSLRALAEQARDKLAPSVVLLGTASPDGRALLVCAVSKDLTARFQAGTLIKTAAAIVGGGGGGRPDFAQAGGSDPSKLADAVAVAHQYVLGS